MCPLCTKIDGRLSQSLTHSVSSIKTVPIEAISKWQKTKGPKWLKWLSAAHDDYPADIGFIVHNSEKIFMQMLRPWRPTTTSLSTASLRPRVKSFRGKRQSEREPKINSLGIKILGFGHQIVIVKRVDFLNCCCCNSSLVSYLRLHATFKTNVHIIWNITFRSLYRFCDTKLVFCDSTRL